MAEGSLLILAGGRSERIKTPKPFLQFGGVSFIENIATEYSRFGLTDIVLVLNERFMRYISGSKHLSGIVPNHHPEYGRFYSLQIGLKELYKSDFIFIHNVDNPFVDRAVLQEMWLKKKEDGFVVPIYGGRGGHPVLISGMIARDIISMKGTGCTLRDVLGDYRRIEVETEFEKVLANINTWEEYEEHILNLTPEYFGG